MELTLKEIFTILKKSIVFILVTAIVFAVCSFFASKFIISKIYTSSVKLYVETTADTSSNGYNNFSNRNYAVALVNTYIEMLETNKFYTQVSDKLNNKFSVTQLSHAVSFSSLNETEVFEAKVVASSPTDAKEIADAVASVAPKIISELKDQNATLKIVDEAVLPTSPSSPNVSKNTLIAFFAGLFLSIVIVIIKKLADVKITYSDELTSIGDMPILAAIPDFDAISSGKKKKREV